MFTEASSIILTKVANGYIVRLPLTNNYENFMPTQRVQLVDGQEVYGQTPPNQMEVADIKIDSSCYVFSSLNEAIGFIKLKIDGGE